MQRTEDNSEGTSPVPECLSDTAGFLLNRAGRIIRERIVAALAPLKLTPQELGILRILNAEGPLSQQALGKRHSLDRTTVVQLIDNLEERDLVVRVSNSADRRSNLLFITPRGRKTLNQAVKIVTREQTAFLAPLSDEEWQTLRVLLIKLIDYHLARRDAD